AKRVEQQRAAYEEDLRSFLELAAVGMGQYDVRSGQLLRTNAKMHELTGYSAEEMSGLGIRGVTHPEDRDRDWDGFEEMLAGSKPVHVSEKRYLRKDGTSIWLLLVATAIRDAAGKAIRTV